MKKFVIMSVATLLSSFIFASRLPSSPGDITAKIREAFHRNFPEVTQASISNLGDYYLVYFTNPEKNSSCRIFYDEDGNVIQTIRNYRAEGLVPFLRAKIGTKYNGKSIFMVTDVSDPNEHYYQVILQDSRSMWVIHLDDNGTTYIQKKYKKAA